MWQVWLITFDVCKYPTRDKLSLMNFYFLFCWVTLNVWANQKSAVFFPRWNQFILLCQEFQSQEYLKIIQPVFFVCCLVQMCIQYGQNDIWEWIVSSFTILIGCYTQTDELPFSYYFSANHSTWWYCTFLYDRNQG